MPRPAEVGPCVLFEEGRDAGRVESPDLTELSGLAASRRQPGVLWAHNDSGDSARLFALGTDGRHLAEVVLSGVGAVDFEDVAIGPGGAQDVLFVGDIGDNGRARASVVVYRLAEPDVTGVEGGRIVVPAEEVEAFELHYPEGLRHDAETLLFDPVEGELYLLTKDLGRPALLFRALPPLEPGRPGRLELAAELRLGSPAVPVVLAVATAGDVSPAGDAVLLRTYADVALWERPPGTPLAEAMSGAARLVPQRLERQGEAIAFGGDGRGYFTASEGEHPTLHFFAPRHPCR